MQIILKVDVPNLGDAGEIVDVARGYANNYLFPREYAIRATSGAIADAAAIARTRVKREASNIANAEQQKAALAAKTLVAKVRAGVDGTLYGSIGKRNVADLVKEQTGIAIKYKNVEMDRPIKTTGDHEIPVKLHRDVIGVITITVQGDVDPAELAAHEAKLAKEQAAQAPAAVEAPVEAPVEAEGEAEVDAEAEA